MIQEVKLINIDTLESFNLKCGEFKMHQGVTTFKHANSFQGYNAESFIFQSNKENKLANNTISFKAIFRDSAKSEVDDFKRFFRRKNARFILQVNKDDRVLYTYCTKNLDTVGQHNDAYSYEEMQITLNQLSLWLEQEIITFEYAPDVNQADYGYASSPDSTDDNEFHYPIIYQGDSASLDYFPVNLPEFKCDFETYVLVVLDEIDTEPAYGLDYNWDNKLAKYSYKAKNTFSLKDDESLMICPYLLNKGIWKNKSQDIFDRGLDLEFERETRKTIDGVTKALDPYIIIEPYEKHQIIFSNVQKGRIYAIKQYANL